MYKYEIGQVLEDSRGKPDGALYDIADEGSILLLRLERPRNEEIEDIRQGSIELRLSEIEGVILMLAKFGAWQWIDAPYNIHLSKNLAKIKPVKEGIGLSCMILLVDTATGKLKVMRLIGFETEFTRSLLAMIERQKKIIYNEKAYNEKIDAIFSQLTSKEIAELSTVKMSIKKKSL